MMGARLMIRISGIALTVGMSAKWREFDELKNAGEVTAAAHDRLLQACLAGRGECDSKQLSPSEQRQVAKADHDRNLENCQYGLEACNPSHLSVQERKQITSARSYQ